MPETGESGDRLAGEAGVLILVVGPSGAGKDTLIDRARLALDGAPVLFARRIVTRPSSDAERHETLDAAAFERAAEQGAFAFRWQAHGLAYAIPIAIEAMLEASGAVVCNVSRGIVRMLRARYARTHVVYIDAPLSIRLSRVAHRGRASERSDRTRRDQEFGPADADVTIVNDGALEAATLAFITAIRKQIPIDTSEGQADPLDV